MRRTVCLLFCLSILCWAGNAHAAHGHYTPGVEGLKVASLPPPGGFYWRMYNAYYSAKRAYDKYGKKVPGRFTADVYALANRFIYSSEIEFLGGNLVFDAIIPFSSTKLSHSGVGAASFSTQKSGVGDIFIEPFLIGWHGPQWDAAIGFSAYIPTGDYSDTEPASPGKGFWTIMTTFGGTYFLDQGREWHVSALARYEIHTQQKYTHITPGQEILVEWGAGKTFGGVFDAGVVGYNSWQLADDSGGNSSSGREQKHAIGGEIAYFFANVGLQVSLRSVWEYSNKNCTQGNLTTLTLTKAF